jgi:hypothetical protein
MSHLVTLKQGTDPDVVYLCTAPDMATIMGGFGPARFVGNTPPIAGASYAITSDDLPRFRVYCTNRQVKVIDGRGTTAQHRPYGREAPLPECRHCAQPARRGAHLQHCPNCGTPWEPIELGAPYAQALAAMVQCASCLRNTPTGYSHCTLCGVPLA